MRSINCIIYPLTLGRILLKKYLTLFRALVTSSKFRPSTLTRRNIAIAMLLLGSTVTLPAHADALKHKVCTSDQARQAAAEANQLNDWQSVHRSFRLYAQCDEGAIGEEYSDSISRLLAHNWKQLGTLVRLMASDPEFERFVIRHIDESMTEDEANLIVSNARLHCPQSAKQFCNAIADY